jgi:hypothetical protein
MKVGEYLSGLVFAKTKKEGEKNARKLFHLTKNIKIDLEEVHKVKPGELHTYKVKVIKINEKGV